VINGCAAAQEAAFQRVGVVISINPF